MNPKPSSSSMAMTDLQAIAACLIVAVCRAAMLQKWQIRCRDQRWVCLFLCNLTELTLILILF